MLGIDAMRIGWVGRGHSGCDRRCQRPTPLQRSHRRRNDVGIRADDVRDAAIGADDIDDGRVRNVARILVACTRHAPPVQGALDSSGAPKRTCASSSSHKRYDECEDAGDLKPTQVSDRNENEDRRSTSRA